MTRSRDVATQGGLVLINTTTLTGTSGTVSFSNVFSSTYNFYRVVLRINTSTGSTTSLGFRTRYGTTDQATGYYGATFYARYNSSGVGESANNATSAPLVQMDGSVVECAISFDVNVNNTLCEIYGNQFNVAQQGGGFFGYRNTAASNVTGFSLIAASGNLTGTVKIYGYKD